MKHRITYLIGVVCMMTSCVNGLFNNITPPEGEIIFTAKLDNAETKTLYGGETNTNNSSTIRVNWVHNDLISVYGHGADGNLAVAQAEYRVGSVKVDANNTPVLDANGNEIPESGKNYANYLQKTGAAGVQWGSATKSDFYAVYPSTSHNFEPTDKGARVQTTIRTMQYNAFDFDEDRKTWVGTPYAQSVNNLTMQDALMYAVTTDKATDNTVDLKFTPWSTVLKFTFKGFDYTLVGAESLTVSVKKIILKAPTSVEIAGDLMLEIDKNKKTAVATPIAGTKVDNEVTIIPDYLPLSEGEAVEFCVYTIPQDNLSFGTDDNNLWKITIETADGTSFTYKLKPSSGSNANLKAGQIHKAEIPVKKIDKPGSLSGSQSHWMEKIPRNVYLSELSLPGSWYSTDSKYSGTESLDDLYTNGVRAFHINCCLNGSGVLVCAGDKGEVTTNKVADKLAKLNSLAAQHPSEYIAVVLSIAEASNGGSVNPSSVLGEIQKVLSSNTLSSLYDKKITSNTTLGEVLGHMIVLINANTSALPNASWFDGNALIAEASLALSNSGNIVAGSFTKMQESSMYWGADATDLRYYYHQAQRTTEDYDFLASHPKFSDRKDAIDDIIAQSDDIYLNSTHNGWFMMGIGGYKVFMLSLGITESTTQVADVLNPYLLDWVERKVAKEQGLYPSPVGIVLMNQPLNKTYYGPQLIEAIMNMNAAFPLAADPEKDEDTGESKPENIVGWVEVSTWDNIYLN